MSYAFSGEAKASGPDRGPWAQVRDHWATVRGWAALESDLDALTRMHYVTPDRNGTPHRRSCATCAESWTIAAHRWGVSGALRCLTYARSWGWDPGRDAKDRLRVLAQRHLEILAIAEGRPVPRAPAIVEGE